MRRKYRLTICLFIFVFGLFTSQFLAEGTISIFTFENIAHHREVLRIGRGTAVNAVWSPDGNAIAVGGSMGIWLYTPAFQDITYFETDAEPVGELKWSPDGTKIATVGGRGSNLAQIRDAKSGVVLQKFTYPDGPTAITWSPDRAQVAIASMYDPYPVDIWDVATGKRLKTFNGAKDRLTTLSWSSDGTKLAGAGFGSPIYVWDVSTGRLVNTLTEFQDLVTSVSFSPDGKTLAGAGNYGGKYAAILWNTSDFHVLSTLPSIGAITVAWNTDGTQIASSSSDGKAFIWNAFTGKVELNLDGNAVDWITWSPDGKRLVGTDRDNTLMIWDRVTGHVTARSSLHNDIPLIMSWRPSSQQLAVVHIEEPAVELLSANTGKQLAKLSLSPEMQVSISFMAWSPNGNLLAGTDGFTTGVWAVSGNTASLPLVLQQGVNTGSLSWDHTSTELAIVSGGDDERQVSIWNAITGAHIITNLKGMTNRVGEASWSPNGEIIATSTFEAQVQLWDATTYLPLNDFDKPDSPLSPNLSFITWSPDNAYLAGAQCGTEGNKVCSFFTWSLTPKRLSPAFEHETGWTWNLVMSPSGKYVATDDDRLVYIWDAITGKLLDTLQGHVGQITSIAWSPNDDKLATASFDGSIRIWELLP